MQLTDINPTPLYPVTIPSTGKKIKFRPFVVKEERALLAAQNSEDNVVMLNTLIQVVMNCLTPQVTSLTNFDFEYLFTQIRAKSVGETSRLMFHCQHCDEGKIAVEVDLSKVTVVAPEGYNKDVKLSPDLVIRMKHVSVEDLVDIESSYTGDDVEFESICKSIDTVFYKDNTIERIESTDQQIRDFVNGLSHDQYEKLKEFNRNQPTVQVSVKYRCPACQHENERTLKGLTSFFY